MKGVRELNLELGRPSADEALRRLQADMAATRKIHQPVMKLIHGYGSSGTGGRIRTAVRKYLAEELSQGRVQTVIKGEDFSIFSEETRQLLARCPALREDRDLDAENRGVTFLLLSEKFPFFDFLS